MFTKGFTKTAFDLKESAVPYVVGGAVLGGAAGFGLRRFLQGSKYAKITHHKSHHQALDNVWKSRVFDHLSNKKAHLDRGHANLVAKARGHKPVKTEQGWLTSSQVRSGKKDVVGRHVPVMTTILWDKKPHPSLVEKAHKDSEQTAINFVGHD